MVSKTCHLCMQWISYNHASQRSIVSQAILANSVKVTDPAALFFGQHWGTPSSWSGPHRHTNVCPPLNRDILPDAAQDNVAPFVACTGIKNNLLSLHIGHRRLNRCNVLRMKQGCVNAQRHDTCMLHDKASKQDAAGRVHLSRAIMVIPYTNNMLRTELSRATTGSSDHKRAPSLTIGMVTSVPCTCQ